MARKASSKPSSSKDSTATIGFEAKVWLPAEKLRNNMEAAEPKQSGDSQPQAARGASRGLRVKYTSEIFEQHRAKLLAGDGDYRLNSTAVRSLDVLGSAGTHCRGVQETRRAAGAPNTFQRKTIPHPRRPARRAAAEAAERGD